MAHYFTAETIYYNAFYAIQEQTHYLANTDIRLFCDLLQERLARCTGVTPDTLNVVFDFAKGERELHNIPTASFNQLSNCIVYTGPEITEADLKCVNSCYEATLAAEALKETRISFSKIFKAQIATNRPTI